MAPFSSLRHPPIWIRDRPLKQVGNKAACHANKRSWVSGASQRAVASSTISTTPSTCRSTGASAPISTPSRRAIDERTESAFSLSRFDLAGLEHVLGESATRLA